jgi:hypothetical protein
MAVSTVPTFFGVSLSGSYNSANFRADKMVVAITITNFLSSVMEDFETSHLGYAAEPEDRQAQRRFQLVSRSRKFYAEQQAEYLAFDGYTQTRFVFTQEQLGYQTKARST